MNYRHPAAGVFAANITGLGALLAALSLQAASAAEQNQTATTASTALDQTQALQQELQAMKADYAKRMAEIEAKLQALQAQNPSATPGSPTPALPPSGKPAKPRRSERDDSQEQPESGKTKRKSSSDETPLAKADKPARQPQDSTPSARDQQNARELDQVQKTFARRTEIRELTQLGPRQRAQVERFNDILQNFVGINGYFRTGFGQSNRGGAMSAFGIPSAPAKYRLGNEAENYGELIFNKNFYLPGDFALNRGEKSNDIGPVAQFNLRLSFFNPFNQSASSSATNLGVPECWASVGRVFASQPDVKFWAGNRFYYRYDLHLNDFFYYNISGGGGGMEDLKIGEGKFAIAWIGAANNSSLYSTYRAAEEPIGSGNFSKWTIDMRYYDFKIGKATGMFGVDFSHQQSGLLDTGTSSSSYDGVALNFIYTNNDIAKEGSLHSMALQLGSGPAKTFTSGFETFTNADGTFIQPQSDESWRFRLADQLVLNINQKLAFGTAMVYQYTDFGTQGGEQHWVSAGVRPIYFFNSWSSLALEAGYDYVSESPLSNAGGLFKLTLAPQVSWEEGFFGRPVLRAFVTWATWANGLEGYVGGSDYRGKNQGLSYGIQMETWW